MAVAVFTSFAQQSDAAGGPLNGGTVTVYAAETTTPLALYSDDDLTIPTANPIPLNSAGRHTNGIAYIAPASYKILLKASNGTTVATFDNVDSGIPIGSGALAIANGGTGATDAAAALVNLGGATAEELADLAAEVAAISDAVDSVERTHIATGSTAQRPATPVEGDLRRNTTIPRWEGYDGSSWIRIVTDTEQITVASQAEALAATDNVKMMTPLRARQGDPFSAQLLHVRDEKASGTDGGTFTSGAWRTRTLNTTKTNEITGATVVANQVSLPAGTYYAEAIAQAYELDIHKCKLRNITDSTDIIIGFSEFASSTDKGGTQAKLRGRFTLAATKTIELQHMCTNTGTTTGFGRSSGLSVVEVYAELLIWKVL